MTTKIIANKIGNPEITTLNEEIEIPGIGETITLEKYHYHKCEVTDVKKDPKTGDILIYVNTP